MLNGSISNVFFKLLILQVPVREGLARVLFSIGFYDTKCLFQKSYYMSAYIRPNSCVRLFVVQLYNYIQCAKRTTCISRLLPFLSFKPIACCQIPRIVCLSLPIFQFVSVEGIYQAINKRNVYFAFCLPAIWPVRPSPVAA